jgi:lysophospholipase L1-like esterase
MRSPRRRLRSFVALLVLWLLAATASLTGPVGASGVSAVRFDVSLGDSYAAGYQPVARAMGHRDTEGFAYQVVRLARAKGYHLELRNFACDGATTTSLLHQKGCALPAPGPDTASYPTWSQAAAAERFLARHHGQIGLVTVSIGGNDILGCASAAVLAACISAALPSIESNVHQLVAGLRLAAGPEVRIVGLTYPDVFLGLYPSADPPQKNLAIDSIPAFRDLLNPALAAQYRAVGATFVDVTAATGAYRPLSEMTSGPHRAVPVAVADVCALTYYCQLQDVHPTNRGYALIARLIVATLPRRR